MDNVPIVWASALHWMMPGAGRVTSPLVSVSDSSVNPVTGSRSSTVTSVRGDVSHSVSSSMLQISIFSSHVPWIEAGGNDPSYTYASYSFINHVTVSDRGRLFMGCPPPVESVLNVCAWAPSVVVNGCPWLAL